MKYACFLLIFLFCFTACQSNSPKKATPNSQNTEIVVDTSTVEVTEELNSEEEEATEVSNDKRKAYIPFEEFSITIHGFEIDESEVISPKYYSDSAVLYLDLDGDFENQLLEISEAEISDLKIEQRYWTSMTVMNEGPHCDLVDWKHYYSPWKELPEVANGQWKTIRYAKPESQPFPKITLHELKKAVKKHCEEDWFELVKNAQSTSAYPFQVLLSHYEIRITCIDTETGLKIVKTILIETPMGC